VREALEKLGEAAHGDQNLMPYIIAAVKDYATEQEVCDVFRDVFGVYRDPGVY
jgi:methylmalonyl-CoA mutase N-terminal domain/subunit